MGNHEIIRGRKRLTQMLQFIGENALVVRMEQEFGEWFTASMGTQPIITYYLHNVSGYRTMALESPYTEYS